MFIFVFTFIAKPGYNKSMDRLKKFESFKDHSMHGKIYKRLTQAELNRCHEFIMTREGMDKDQFAHELNRWMLHEEKPKHHTDMWALVMQSNS